MARHQTPQQRAIARLSAAFYRPDDDPDAGARQRDDLAYRYPALTTAIEAVILANPHTESRFICPGCRRPFAPGTRVPRDTTGVVIPCRDCRIGVPP